MPKVVLTSDQAIFTDFSGLDALGFGLCLPYRLVPRFIQYRILSPSIPLINNRAPVAPYPLSKIEAALLAAGFKREDVYIVPPSYLSQMISEDTAVVGIHVLDPMGLAPVSWTLRVLSGGGDTCTHYEFEKLMRIVRKLKERYRFKVIVGGPGVWQLKGLEDRYGIDVLFEGEAELTFPKLVNDILNGKEVPRYVFGESIPPNLIPPIITPSRNGIVQVTRGCPRRCKFCSPTMFYFRSIPLETVMKEVEVNLRSGIKSVGFATEDILLYGAKGLRPNLEAIKKLFDGVIALMRKYRVTNPVGFSHVTLSTALAAKEAVRYISEVNRLGDDRPSFPQVGIESGSPRIVAKYFRGKPYPWKPEEWQDVVVDGSKLLNDNYWYPCYTYIIGFPDATPDDYILTIELLDRLREEGFKGWTFPLLLVPIGGTLIERSGFKEFLTLKKLPQEAIDAIVAGWRLSIRFSYEIYPKLLSGIRNPITRRIVSALAKKAIDAMKEWLEGIRRNPEIIERIFSKVNIRTTVGLTKTLI
ncbi:MAG TPA: B12-binding domain-containing radical SAM protein, partial [Acidilobales archaeon]|nr:B12-binding domain-containing radical SAM protein [Acidilobales archaeon]